MNMPEKYVWWACDARCRDDGGLPMDTYLLWLALTEGVENNVRRENDDGDCGGFCKERVQHSKVTFRYNGSWKDYIYSSSTVLRHVQYKWCRVSPQRNKTLVIVRKLHLRHNITSFVKISSLRSRVKLFFIIVIKALSRNNIEVDICLGCVCNYAFLITSQMLKASKYFYEFK